MLNLIFRWGTHLNYPLFLFVCLSVRPSVRPSVPSLGQLSQTLKYAQLSHLRGGEDEMRWRKMSRGGGGVGGGAGGGGGGGNEEDEEDYEEEGD